jgi:hypothetical protein
MDNSRECPRRNQDGWNSSDSCSESDNKRFEEHSGQRIPSKSQLVGKGTSRYMIPHQVRPTMYESENFGTKFSLRGEDCNIPGIEVIK